MLEIFLDGIVGYDFFASDIRNQLKDANGKDIKMLISSPGGFVSDGLAIANLMRQYEGRINVEIIGEAASMATYIAMFGDTVKVFDNSVFMIHNALGAVWGDSRDMQKYANMLESLTKMLANAYVQKTGLALDEIRDLMNEETFLFGEEIKELGFADTVIESQSIYNDEEKNQKITETKMLIENAQDILKEFKKEDYEKAAALIKPLKSTTRNSKAHKPDETGHNIKKEVTKMTLQEFLKSDPVAMQEYNNALVEAKNSGVTDGEKKVSERIEKVQNFINSTEYVQAIKDMAIDVIKGEASIKEFQSIVAIADQIAEKEKSNLAKLEADKIGDTQAQQKNKTSTDGVINTEDDFQESVARIKNGGVV